MGRSASRTYTSSSTVFEELWLLTSNPIESYFLTKGKRGIKTVVAPEPGAQARLKFDRLRKAHPRWQLRKQPTGVYNCFGLACNSRRGAFYEQSDVDLVLVDDGYRDLADNERPLWG